jgi:hypothetical protein
VSCAICEIRKEKRFCPAIHGRICAQCCGENREVTLDCPSDCSYLRQAREHEGPRQLKDIDQKALFLEVELGEQFLYEHEHLIAGMTYSLARSAKADRTLNDSDLIAALTALTKTVQIVVNSGLHVDSPITNAAQHAVIADLQKVIQTYRETERKHLGFERLRDSEVLRALVFMVRLAQARTSARPKSRAFVQYLLDQFPQNEPVLVSADDVRSRIITP